MRISCYEDLAHIPNRLPTMLEAYSGSDIVQWFGNIERQIVNMIDDQEASRNHTYADKLREFLKVWRDNELTGSINIEQLLPLKAASSILAVDTWKLNDYFSSLAIQIKRIIASEEELPPMGGVPSNKPKGPSASFGASSSAPKGPAAEEPVPGENKPPEEGEEKPPAEDEENNEVTV